MVASSERRQESNARSKYAEVLEHTTTCKSKKRRTDQWRAVINWTEEQVWEMLKRHKVNPHPAYRLGFSHVSCMCCIFGNADQWAAVRKIAPRQFVQIMQYEKQFDCTINRNYSVWEQALRGRSFVTDADADLVRLALSKNYSDDIFVPEGQEWVLPRGAFKRQGGPT